LSERLQQFGNTMRDFKGIKRNRNRNRNGGGGGGGKPQHNANRAFDSNGPDGVKVRGAAQHVYEKYQQLARDAHTSGDRVLAENHLQHAEHYFRVLRAMQPQRPLSEIIGRDQFVSGYDIDFEEEPQAAAEGETEAVESDQSGERGEGRGGEERTYRPRDEWRGEERYNDRGQGGQGQGGSDRSQGAYRPRDDRYRDYRDNRRDDRPRYDRQDRLQDRPQERDFARPDRPPRPEGERQESSERPAEPTGQMLRADDGGASHAPAFLQAPVVSETESAAPRPRRRRVRSVTASSGEE
jgi:hypothetical protein